MYSADTYANTHAGTWAGHTGLGFSPHLCQKNIKITLDILAPAKGTEALKALVKGAGNGMVLSPGLTAPV